MLSLVLLLGVHPWACSERARRGYHCRTCEGLAAAAAVLGEPQWGSGRSVSGTV